MQLRSLRHALGIPALTLAASLPLSAQSADQISAALGDMEWRHIGPVNMGGRVSAILGVPGISVKAAHNCRDKARMKDVLREAGLPCAGSGKPPTPA